MDVSRIAEAVERWAEENLEELPWRREGDLYRVLLAEILLKRTTRRAATRAYLQFVRRFPTLDDLCRGRAEEVEELLKPIGLYRQRTEQILQLCQHRQLLERASSWRDLLRLPGVGAYTARAVGAVLFGERVLGVDGNVKRVLSRVFGRYDAATAEALAGAASSPRLLQLGLVDIGYRICRPRRPRCGACPLAGVCLFRSRRRPRG